MGKKVGRSLKITKSIALVLLALVLFHLIYVLVDGFRDYRGHADIAVVLGNRVNSDSSLSPALKGRVDKALLLYRQGRVNRIMVSGGHGLAETSFVPEGMAMKRYLVAQGVPPDLVVEDNDGENTYLTGRDFLHVADSLHIRSAIIVSSFYHVTRSKYIIRKLGFSTVHSASSDAYFTDDLIGLPRDMVALYKYVLVY